MQGLDPEDAPRTKMMGSQPYFCLQEIYLQLVLLVVLSMQASTEKAKKKSRYALSQMIGLFLEKAGRASTWVLLQMI